MSKIEGAFQVQPRCVCIVHAQGFAGEESLDGVRQTVNIPAWDKDAATASIEQLRDAGYV